VSESFIVEAGGGKYGGADIYRKVHRDLGPALADFLEKYLISETAQLTYDS